MAHCAQGKWASLLCTPNRWLFDAGCVHVDAKTSRSGAGQPLYVFVSRVLLGNSFVCSTPTPYKRPPCSHAGCASVSGATPCESHAGVTYDSVIGTCRDGRTRLIFREFVVYEKTLSYPEFLVEYVRQT